MAAMFLSLLAVLLLAPASALADNRAKNAEYNRKHPECNFQRSGDGWHAAASLFSSKLYTPAFGLGIDEAFQAHLAYDPTLAPGFDLREAFGLTTREMHRRDHITRYPFRRWPKDVSGGFAVAPGIQTGPTFGMYLHGLAAYVYVVIPEDAQLTRVPGVDLSIFPDSIDGKPIGDRHAIMLSIGEGVPILLRAWRGWLVRGPQIGPSGSVWAKWTRTRMPVYYRRIEPWDGEKARLRLKRERAIPVRFTDFSPGIRRIAQYLAMPRDAQLSLNVYAGKGKELEKGYFLPSAQTAGELWMAALDFVAARAAAPDCYR
jgi:hypothetical protein